MQATIKSLDDYVVYLEEQQDELWTTYQAHQRKTTAAKITLEGFADWQNPELARERSALYHAHIKPEDLTGCKTQRAALEQIALISDGMVKVVEASQLILDAGLSKGRKASVIATSHRTMTEDEKTWTWVAPGLFSYNLPAQRQADLHGSPVLQIAAPNGSSPNILSQ